MRNILITGAAGFIGSHLTEQCLDSGCRVKVFVRYNSANSWGWIEDLSGHEQLEVISGDVRDFDLVFSAMTGCDTVFHLAALIGIPYSYYSPLAYIRTNVEGTYNVLQAAKELGVGNVCVVSTSEIYGTAQYVPIDERHPLSGQSPYAASKIAAEQLALSYFRSFGTPIKVIRPFNTYGPRQSARAIIPTIITQLLTNPSALFLGNLDPSRDLTFVKDTVSGMIEIAKQESLIGDTVNIGTGHDVSVGDLVRRIETLLGVSVPVRLEPERVRPQKSEVLRLCCDNTKIVKATGWKPSYTLDQGLEETIEWFKKHLGCYKPSHYNL